MSCNNAECCIISFTHFFFFFVRKSQHSKQRKHPLYLSKHNVATVVFHVCTMKEYDKWRGGILHRHKLKRENEDIDIIRISIYTAVMNAGLGGGVQRRRRNQRGDIVAQCSNSFKTLDPCYIWITVTLVSRQWTLNYAKSNPPFLLPGPDSYSHANKQTNTQGNKYACHGGKKLQ